MEKRYRFSMVRLLISIGIVLGNLAQAHDGHRPLRACVKANTKQRLEIARGNQKLQKFLTECAIVTDNSPWCTQLIRPNPDRFEIFRCTYGEKQPYQLINPDESTWPNAFKAVQLVKDLEQLQIDVCLIYNWWRPAPYNKNIGGSAGRHPFGTSIDVRLCTIEDMDKAFLKLGEWRAEGKLKAVGYYGTTGLHFGIGDRQGNTWGKECPRSD